MTWPVAASVTRPITVPEQKAKTHPMSGPKSNLHPALSSVPTSAAMLAVAFRGLSMRDMRSVESCSTLRAARQAIVKLRSEEHTSELQSLAYLVCRLLLEKKKKETPTTHGTPSSSIKPQHHS